MHIVRVMVAVALALCPAAAQAQNRSLGLPLTASPPRIDAEIGADEWLTAARTTLDYQTEPGENVEATESTEVLLTSDEDALYIAVRAADSSPNDIRARVSRRDDISADDQIIVALDTDDARQRAYRFFINPIGIQADSIFTVAGNDDYSWDGVFEARGRMTAAGYEIEARIPFKSMRFRSGPGSQWGLHIQRWIARKAERTSWMPISRANSSYMSQMGALTGLDRAKGGRAIDLVPTIVSAAGESRPTAAAPLATLKRNEVGLTGLYALTSNLTLSGTVNPDFSQVEADAPQITVNQRFAISFPEKRPFFLEGAEFFASAVPGAFRLLDTRTLVNPDWGLKLTGRAGRQAVGVLSASDQVPDADNATVTAVRYQRDLLTDAAVGGTVVDRHHGGVRNTVVAADARFRLKRVTTTGVQLGRSISSDAGGTRTGLAYRAMWATYARTWKIFLWHQGTTKDFRAASGFLSRTGFHQSSVDVGYEWRPAKATWWTSVWPYFIAGRSWDAGGRFEFDNIDPALQVDLARNVRVNYYSSFNRENYAGGFFKYAYHDAQINVNRFKRITFSSAVQFGTRMLYDPARPQVGRSLALRQSATIRAHDQLRVFLQYIASDLDRRDGGETLSSQHLSRLRVEWQARPSSGVRVLTDYNSASRRLGWSVLYAFTPRPMTAFYVGYDDQQIDDRMRTWSRQQRTLFVKLSYGLRM